MPDPTLSDAIKEAYASAPSDVVCYDTLEIAHPVFTQSIYAVRDWNSLTATLEDGVTEVTFVAIAFNLLRPEVSADGVPQCTITLDSVPHEILEYFRQAAQSTTKVTVKYRQYLSTDLSHPQNNPPLTATLTSIKANSFRVTAIAGFGDYRNKRFPPDDYTGERFAGLIT